MTCVTCTSAITVCLLGHVKFLPVVGVSSLHGLTWKLDPGHMILQLKALLPYNKVREV